VNDEYNPSTRFASHAGRARPVAVTVALGAALGAAILAVPAIRHWRETPPAPSAPLRAAWVPPVSLLPGAGPDYPFGLAIAPDGRRLAFPAARDGIVALWLQDLRTGRVDALPGTDGAALPFWTPDGTRVAFFAKGRLFALDVESGRTTDLAEAPEARGGTFTRGGGVIFAASARGGLQHRRADGTVEALTTPDTTAGETAHLLPVALDDDRHFVFLVRSTTATRQGIWLAALDRPDDRVRLTSSASHGIVADGHLVYGTEDAIVAQSIDLDGRRLASPVAVLGLQVGRGPLGQLFATASSDTLIYGPPASQLRELVWVSRSGEPVGTVGGPGEYWTVRVDPDGRRVAVSHLSPQLRTPDVVLFEGSSPVPNQLSLSTDADEYPAWSPDGLRVAWTVGRRAITIRGAGAQLPAETVARVDDSVRVTDWTPDGRAIVFTRLTATMRDDIWLAPIAGGEPRPLVTTAFADAQGSVSPDGRWIAYASDESGEFEVYVEAVMDRSPEPAARVRVTSGGGSDPRWRRDGRELFFRRGSEVHVATLALGRGQNELASTSMLVDTRRDLRSFDVSPDGQRFLLNLDREGPSAGPPTIVVGWLPAITRPPR
jgi:Tol biopolymer transport system component